MVDEGGTPPLTDEELAEMQEWSERATPGPWNVETESEGMEYGALSLYARGVSGGDPKEWVWVVRFDDDYGTDQMADAHFIAAARQLWPRLIAALRASRGSVAILVQQITVLEAKLASSERLLEVNRLRTERLERGGDR